MWMLSYKILCPINWYAGTLTLVAINESKLLSTVLVSDESPKRRGRMLEQSTMKLL